MMMIKNWKANDLIHIALSVTREFEDDNQRGDHYQIQRVDMKIEDCFMTLEERLTKRR